jgi:hypothetical protein
MVVVVQEMAPRPAADLVPLIKEELVAGSAHEGKASEHYRKAGELLLEAKAGLKHGEFKPWIRKNFRLSYQSATDYMRLARNEPKVERAPFLDRNEPEGDRAPSLREAKADSATRRNARRETPEPDPQHEPPRVSFQSDPKTVRRKALAVEMLQTGFKKLAFERHPGRGGSHERMAELADARDWAVEFIEHPPLINLDY